MASGKITPATIGMLAKPKSKRKYPETIKAKCPHDFGWWFCITHNESFENQFQKDSHIHDGDHCLAWFCRNCGTYQVP